MLTNKQVFSFAPTETLRKLYIGLKENTLQRHVSVNHAIYVETNRDAVDSVFSLLKDSDMPVYKQPAAKFMYDYVNMHSLIEQSQKYDK